MYFLNMKNLSIYEASFFLRKLQVCVRGEMYIFDIGYFVRIPLAFFTFAQSNEVAVGKIELPSLLNANMHCFLSESVFIAIRFAKFCIILIISIC